MTAGAIVQAASADAARQLVLAAGGSVTHELRIIDAVAAELTAAQAAELETDPGLRRLWADRRAELTGKGGTKGGKSGGDTGGTDTGGSNGGGDQPPEASDPAYLVGADLLHTQGVAGHGVTVAVLDTGMWMSNDLKQNPDEQNRLLATFDVFGGNASDDNGHGSHLSSIILNRARYSTGLYASVAPYADLVVVKAFDANGSGTYADVIRGLQWVVDNRDAYGIRVLNLSFSATPQSHYWDDPLNQAVMEAWRAGIVVVASAGNGGPGPMTIGVPGNVPYVITVGAMSDKYTLTDPLDDALTTFSAAGPTVEGFVKPEVVAPGGHLVGLMYRRSTLPKAYPQFYDEGKFFMMSGTSQATAVVSGVVALMLQDDPELTPDQVKYRLMASARPAVDAGGMLAYSVFQQGAGAVHADDAVRFDDQGPACDLDCDGDGLPDLANRGLDIDKDLAGVEHYGGRADQLPDGTYYLREMSGDGLTWSDGALQSGGFLWSDGFVWSNGMLWSDAFLWSDGLLWSDASTSGMLWSDAFSWSDAFLWSEGFLWSDTSAVPAAINTWVAQE